MESTYDFEVSAPSHIVFKYVFDPNNLLKYVPAFRGLRQLDPNTWELEVKWLFSIKLTVSRMILPNEIDQCVVKLWQTV